MCSSDLPAEHVEEIGVAASVELIGALDFHAALPEKIDNRAVKHGRAELRFDVVADDRQIFVGKSFCPNRVAGDEDGNVVYEGDSGLERAAGVKPGRFIGADRQIIDHDLGGGIFQLTDNLFAGGFFFQGQKCAERIVVGHVRGEAVHDHAHFHDVAGKADFVAKDFGAIGRRENGFADIEPDFAAVDIEGGHNFDVSGPIRGDLLVHQADGGAIDGGTAIKIDTLDERTGTVAHSDDGDTNLSHGKKEILPGAMSLGQDAMW